MRVLLLLRGSAGCGKSTWIKQNGLKPFTLSADEIRLLCQSPIMQVDGTPAISQANDKTVWKILYDILEVRMQHGEFTVIDATNSKASEMNRYKELCDAYRYRIYCVDFTDIPIDEVKRRNAERDILKRVPDEVIDKMYSRFATQKIPAGITVIHPNELNKIWFNKMVFSNYKKIHVFGDIHGCNTVLQQYFKDNDGIKDDEFYIFTGDYIDRGCENADTLKFLMSLINNKNVFMLEGNHERHLWNWANDKTGASKEFEMYTRPELELAKIDKKEVRKFYRRLGQCAYFKYNDKTFLITHGGISTIPDNLTFVATEQMIRGTGNYNDYEIVENTFKDTTPENYVQIHAHRNTKNLPVKVNDKVYNLEGQVEFGGQLRIVQINETGINTIEIQNTVFNAPEYITEKEEILSSSITDILLKLRSNPLITEKKFDNISSFNFTRDAFERKEWNEQTITARGLYIDTAKAKVVCRGYPKFFNVNERPETKFETLQHRLQFPVTAYIKENGFLGLVSYNEYTDDLFITTKSNPDGPYAEWFKNLLYDKISSDNINALKTYIKEHNVTFAFECVDMINDPHIIEYPESRIYLLDIINNDINFSKYEYSELSNIAANFGLTPKTKGYEIANWQDFYDWYYEVLAEDYTYNNNVIEGFVIEDPNGFMTKLKLTYYNFWKFMRGLSHEVLRSGNSRKTSALTTPLANEYFGWLKKKYAEGNTDSLPRDICSLRKMFYNEKGT